MEKIKWIRHLFLKEKINLHTIEDMPPKFRRRGILRGYRPVPLSTMMCLVSTLRIHNETGNIWTHLLGFVILSVIGVNQLASVQSDNFADFLALFIYYVGASACMLLSATYHTGKCHSESARVLLLDVDVFGICLLLLTSYLPSLVFGFYCNSWTSAIYIGIASSAVLSAFVVPCMMHGHADNDNGIGDKKKRDSISPSSGSGDVDSVCTATAIHETRTVLLCGAVVFCVIPIIHWLYISDAEEINMFLGRLLTMLGLYGFGFFFYLTNLPETKYPGKFDIWFHSHQFWHVIVLLAAIIWAYTLPDILHFKYGKSCKA